MIFELGTLFNWIALRIGTGEPYFCVAVKREPLGLMLIFFGSMWTTKKYREK